MTEIIITIDNEALAFFSAAPARLQRALRLGTEDAADHLMERMRTYPDQSTGKINFVSEKQRRFFFWALNEGIITVPYRRTRTLAKSWSRTVQTVPGGAVGEVGSNENIAPYNRFVQDRTQQARIHRGNWHTVQSVVAASRSHVHAMYVARIRQAIR